MLPIEIARIAADYLHCDIEKVNNGYKLVMRPCKYFEILTDIDGNTFVVPCATM